MSVDGYTVLDLKLLLDMYNLNQDFPKHHVDEKDMESRLKLRGDWLQSCPLISTQPDLIEGKDQVSDEKRSGVR
jgi:hypothetical protein